MDVKRVVVLCEEAKARYSFPACHMLQSCGREVYLVNNIVECCNLVKKLVRLNSTKIILVIPLMQEFNYSAYGWSKTRKSSIQGVNYVNQLVPHLQVDENNDIITGVYLVTSSEPERKTLPELMDSAAAQNQLKLQVGAIICESYMNAAEKIILTSSSSTPKLMEAIAGFPTPLPKQNIGCAKRILFIRHGQRLDENMPDWATASERPQDTPMTQKGLVQCTCAGVWLANQSYPIDAIYASPFYRTVHTAHLILEQVNQGNRDNKANVNLFAPPLDPFAQLMLQHTHQDISSPATNISSNLQINIENGLADEPDWMATNAKPTKPWFLKAGDFCIVSDHINLNYSSVKTPLWDDGDCYPGRPVEQEEIYDRCSVAIWRLALNPLMKGKTIVVVSHAGPIMNMIHALTGRGVGVSMRHTCITSVVLDEKTGVYAVEKEELPTTTLANAYLQKPGEMKSGEEILCSVKHLAENMRS